MPLLILNLPNFPPRGLILEGRVVIGRRPFDTILVPDASVSRIHAWIGAKKGRFFVYDAGSRSGTFVNDQQITEPRELADGDEVRIGPGVLTFIEGDVLPADVQPLAPSPPPPASDPYDGGIYFDCTCGGPMWVTADLAGAAGKCRYCGQRLIVPHMSGQIARLLQPMGATAAQPKQLSKTSEPIKPPVPSRQAAVDPAVAREVASSTAVEERPATEAATDAETTAPTCSICQTEILPGEEQTQCPSCHLTFHTQCWQENQGCSAYGCDQVNILAPRPPAQAAPPVVDDVVLLPVERARHWDLVLVALSFVGLGLGPLVFGATSVIMLIWTTMFLLTRRAQRPLLVVLGLIVSLLGAVAGFVTSMFWYRGVRLWELVIKP